MASSHHTPESQIITVSLCCYLYNA